MKNRLFATTFSFNSPQRKLVTYYCYCYLRQWLDRHMRQAERGIRFITPDYKEVFRLSDGDKIRMVLPSGEKEDYTCRYVDETHLEVGRNLYHICEFAERMKDNGRQLRCFGCRSIQNSNGNCGGNFRWIIAQFTSTKL